MSDSINCVPQSFPQTAGRSREDRNRLKSERKLKEAARIARFAQHLVPATCEEFELTAADLLARSQERRRTRARQLMFWICSNHPDALFSGVLIAEHFKWDRATIMYALDAHQNCIDRDFQKTRAQTQRVINRLSFHGFSDWKVTP